MEKLKKLLKSIGIEESTIEKLVSEEQDFDPAKVAASVKKVMRESLENDPDFVSQYEESARGRVLSSKENKILKLSGITREELEAMPKEKRFDTLMEMAIERAKGENGADEPTKKELERLRKRVQELSDELTTGKEALTKAQQAGEIIRGEVAVERDLRRAISKHKLVIGEDDATELLFSNLKKEFDLRHVGGKTGLYKKGTDFKATDPETERELELEKLVEKQLIDRKWKQVSNGAASTERVTTEDTKGGRRPVSGQGAPKKELPGIAAAEAAAEARKTAKKD